MKNSEGDTGTINNEKQCLADHSLKVTPEQLTMKNIRLLVKLLVVTSFTYGTVDCITMRRIYSLFTEPRTWNEAASICSSQYGQLVKINNQTEIYELIYLDEYHWGYNLSTRLNSGFTFWSGHHRPLTNSSTVKSQDCVLAVTNIDFSVNYLTCGYYDCEFGTIRPFWPQALLNSGFTFWSGHHRPLTNSSTVKFQDCEMAVTSIDFSVNGLTCGYYDSNFGQSMAACNERKMFICQRYEGDCWYQPILNEQPTVTTMTTFITHTGSSAIDCAMVCRNFTNNSGDECWAFLYQSDPHLRCQFYAFTGDYVSTSGAAVTSTSDTAFFKHAANRQTITQTGSDFIFYVRICFEGTLDMTVYSQYVNNDLYPNTDCATTTKTSEDTDTSDICYCATDEQPPIPKPISSEAEAEELVKELTIEVSNTSAAQRRLISAEDDRPSAVGVGYVGVALMVGVFGGLFLMDASLLVRGVQQILRSLK